MDTDGVTPEQEDVELEELEEFLSDKHPEFLLAGLNGLREENILCDFTLVSESSSFSLHRALLASCSDYLKKALLTSAITDGKQDKVELEGVTVEGVRCLLDILYATKAEVNDDNVKQVLGVASCLQIPPIVQACYDFIVEGGSESAKLDHDSGEHSRKILKGLNALRRNGQLCDILLISCKQKFLAHRAVLAACSDYFRAMLTGSLKESKEREIVLHGMKASALEACIDFIYSGQIGLSPQNIGDIINVAAYLQIPTVLELCCTYYKDSITVENCLEITHAAQSYGVTELKEFADDFIVRNFHTFAETEKFETLTQKELIGYLERNSIGASELEVFRFALKWIDADHDARVKDACTIMQCVRFPLMSDRDIMEKVQEVGFMMMDPKCHALLVESFTYKAFPYKQNSLQSPQTQVRATEDAVIVIGGETDQAISRELMFCDGSVVSSSVRWKTLRPMPSPPRKYHCAAIMDNYLYVVGGTLPGTHLSSGFRYDPRFDAWVPIAPMQEARYYFQLVARRGHLYAIAGKLGPDILSSVEQYSPELNRWATVKPLEVEVYGHAACVCEDEVYISGGRVEGHYHDYLVRYDPDQGCEQLKPMHDARSGHNMCAVRGDIYVIGGCAVATMESQDNMLPFLDTKTIIEKDGRLQFEVYRKPTHTDQYLAFDSHHPLEHKLAVIKTLFHRADNIITSDTAKTDEHRHLRGALGKCGYQRWTFNKALKPSDQSKKTPKCTPLTNRNKANITIPYVQGVSEKLRRIFQNFNIATNFKPQSTLRQRLVHPKDRPRKVTKADVIYRLRCEELNCNNTYIGETSRSLNERYDRVDDSWQFLAPVLSPQTGAGIAVFHDRIYILGGINWNTWKFSSEIQGYDMEGNTWSVVGHLPDIYDGLCSGVLVLSQQLRDKCAVR
ncbi:KLHL9 [Branchiostoma lanceolatum]|uniref:KLHL9 protein n=1 Tax=Branchiostoma lanceolatum TaxID=7740 RepID=A0A8K0A3U3_BRALA|nr:KLHL9 [Branchiostoma lanceolatum]